MTHFLGSDDNDRSADIYVYMCICIYIYVYIYVYVYMYIYQLPLRNATNVVENFGFVLLYLLHWINVLY